MLWWGYLHSTGSLQVKRFFDSRDITDAQESPFVSLVKGPWEVSSRAEAIEKLEQDLGINKKGEEDVVI